MAKKRSHCDENRSYYHLDVHNSLSMLAAEGKITDHPAAEEREHKQASSTNRGIGHRKLFVV